MRLASRWTLLSALFTLAFFGSLNAALAEEALLLKPGEPGQEAGPIPFNIDHYKCYPVISSDPFGPRTVTLRDQFKASTAVVVRPHSLCNPVIKNGEPWHFPEEHLVCYEIDEIVGPVQLWSVQIENQFGPLQLKVSRPNLLCVPSTKVLLGAGE